MPRSLAKRRGGVVLSLACVLCAASLAMFYAAASALADCNPEDCTNGCCGTTCLGSNQGCCEGNVYDLNTQACCEGTVYTTASQGCCGGRTYTLNTEGCCSANGTDTVYTYETEYCCEACGCVSSY